MDTHRPQGHSPSRRAPVASTGRSAGKYNPDHRTPDSTKIIMIKNSLKIPFHKKFLTQNDYPFFIQLLE